MKYLLIFTLFLSGCHFFHPTFKLGDCIIKESKDNFTGKVFITEEKILEVGYKAYKTQYIRIDKYENLVGTIWSDSDFYTYDFLYNKTECPK